MSANVTTSTSGSWWDYVPFIRWGTSATDTTASQAAIRQIAEENIPFDTASIVKKGDQLPRFLPAGVSTKLIKIENLGTGNTVRELFHALASQMECSAEKIHLFFNGKTLNLSEEDAVVDGTIESAFCRLSPWGVSKISLMWVQKSPD